MRKLAFLLCAMLLLSACAVGAPAPSAREVFSGAGESEHIWGSRENKPLTVGGIVISSAEMSTYYYSIYSEFLSQYINQLLSYGFDPDVQLDRQECFLLETGTWDDFFYDYTVRTVQNKVALGGEAEKAGLTLADAGINEQELKSEVEAHFAVEGQLTRYQELYGPDVTGEVFFTIYKRDVLASLLDEKIVTDVYEATSSYGHDDYMLFYANSAEYKLSDYRRTVDVRHILVADRETAEKLAALARFNPSEEYFASLAALYTTDTASASGGGLYAGVAKGQMVAEFDAWCFSPVRFKRNIGIVKTTYGYHVIYFCGVSDNDYWKTFAKDKLAEKNYLAKIDEITGLYPIS